MDFCTRNLIYRICRQVWLGPCDACLREGRLSLPVRQAHLQAHDGDAGGVLQAARTPLRLVRPGEERGGQHQDQPPARARVPV